MVDLVNVDEVATALRAGLELAGADDVVVLDVAAPMSALPAVAFAPGDDEVVERRVLRHSFDVVVMVPRDDQVARYRDLADLTVIVVDVLNQTAGVALDGTIGFTTAGGTGTGEPPYMARLVPITFTGTTLTC